MNRPYPQTAPQAADQAVAGQSPLPGAAQQAAGRRGGALTGQGVAAGKKPKARKAASAFRTISEVAAILEVQQHVLRFWETKFSQVRPLKRGGGRRYYRPEDLELLRRIHHLLYTEGYTIKGVQKLLREKGKAAVLGESSSPPQNNNARAAAASRQEAPPAGMSAGQRTALQALLGELKALRALIAAG